MKTPDTLCFVTRDDLSPVRRAAQLIHSMDEWAAAHGSQRGTVIVYGVTNEKALLRAWETKAEMDGVLFREPDLGDAATAFATARGPFRLPLLR